jgi:mannose-6-phosphate isomerase-like protein (cupin superfamily)
MEKVNLAQKFALFSEQWSPKLIGELNGQQIKIAKLQGEFVWHHHEAEDEFFMVIEGRMTIKLPDQEIELGEGEFLIVPRGVEHKPVAKDQAQIMMFEPAGTLNTGNVQNEHTIENIDRL